MIKIYSHRIVLPTSLKTKAEMVSVSVILIHSYSQQNAEVVSVSVILIYPHSQQNN